MGRLEDLEFRIMGNSQHGLYHSFVKESQDNGKSNYFDQIRYALAISHNSQEAECSDKIMFLGGLGVIGNIVSSTGVSPLFRWRGTHDIDFALKSKDYLFVAETSFDHIDSISKSLSISNKYSLRAFSTDSENQNLCETHADIYVPKGDPRHGIPIEEKSILPVHWENMKQVDFFGVPLNVPDSVTLLGMKINLGSIRKTYPRPRDCADVVHLLAVAERDNYSSSSVRNSLTTNDLKRLKNILNSSGIYSDKEEVIANKYIISPSADYIDSIVSDSDLQGDLVPAGVLR